MRVLSQSSASALFVLLLSTPLTQSAANDGSWYHVDAEQGQSPWNVQDLGNNRVRMTVKPNEEAVRISSKQMYSAGKFEFKVKSAAVMPGIVTAVYFASGEGRKGDESTGRQDEIDLEWKGNDPSRVQTNVFLNGQEDLKLIDLQVDSSANERIYAIEWGNNRVAFLVDGQEVRSKWVWRQLQPMQLHMAVWTTMGGWPGLIQWGGKTDWYANGRNGSPATATFEILSFPTTAGDA